MESTQGKPRNSGAYVAAAILMLVGVLALLANLGAGGYLAGSVAWAGPLF